MRIWATVGSNGERDTGRWRVESSGGGGGGDHCHVPDAVEVGRPHDAPAPPVHGETLQTPTLFPMPWGHLDTLRPPPEKALPEPVDLDTFARPDWL